MNKKPPYYIADFTIYEDIAFKKFFINLSAENQYCFLKDVFSENEESLSYLFHSEKDITSFEKAFLYLRNLSSEIIKNSQEIIERILREVQASPLEDISKLTFKNIRVLVLVRKEGLSIGFLNSTLLLDSNLPNSIKNDFAKLLVYLDPIGKTFNWNTANLLNDYPHLISAKMILYANRPLEVLIEFLSVEEEPEKEIVSSIVKRPLKNCLENLLIFQNKLSEYLTEIEPLLDIHWSKKYFTRIINSPIFINNRIPILIDRIRIKHILEVERKSVAADVYNKLSGINSVNDSFEEILSEHQITALFNSKVRDEIILRSLQLFVKYGNEQRIYLYTDPQLIKNTNVLMFFYQFFRFRLFEILRKQRIEMVYDRDRTQFMFTLPGKAQIRSALNNTILFLKSKDSYKSKARVDEIIREVSETNA